jgi:rubrerythrin
MGEIMIDMKNESSAGPSPWERDLYAHLSEHADAERGLLEQYSTVAKETPSKAFQYLVNLLIEEEIRHHKIFSELAESLKDEALAGGRNAIIPTLDFDRANHDAVLDATQRLLANEQKDARDLKGLRRSLRDVKDTSLWSLLVELMERDTQKHIAILTFVRKHA